jgi:serine/threonine protein kinase
MPKCKQCGFELKENVRYCTNCAAKVDAPMPQVEVADAFTGTISGAATCFAPERADSSLDLETGKEFHSRYRIERKLGQGAMGVVYLGSDKLTGRQVALKLINPILTNRASARERFLREGLIARDIRHTNVVAVYDVNETEGQYYLVMEFLSGETLRTWLHRIIKADRDVPYATAVKIIRNILNGLDAAHTAGVIHRDVKPENIMLTGDPEAGDYSLKILDFGIARAIDSAAKQVVTTTTSTGTALYMAPEQKTAADTVGPPADLYAVTAIFYELLLGVAPTGRWAPLSKEREDLPADLDAVIDKGLSSRPRSRYQNAQEYLKAIGEIRSAPLPSALASSGSHSSAPATGIGRTIGHAQAPFAGRSTAGLPKTHPVAAAGSAQPQRAAAQRWSFNANEPAPVPRIISGTGRLRTELLVLSNAPPDGLHQSVWQTLEAFGLREMQSQNQIRFIRGTTGFNWKSYGQRISAKIEEVPGGSTVNIIGQAKGPGLTDMGRGKEEVHTMTGMLVKNLADAGWKAYIVREVHQSLPAWLLVLILLGGLFIFGILMSIITVIDNA